MLTLNLYRIKEVGGDYIMLADDTTDVKITFADGSGSVIDIDPATTKEETAQTFKGKSCQVGLEIPVLPLRETRTNNLFLDHHVGLLGGESSVPCAFRVSRIEVSTTSHS
jgi:hypothetical protein